MAGKKSARRDVVLLNAAAALVAAGRADHLRDAVPLAAKAIDSGAAEQKLTPWRRFPAAPTESPFLALSWWYKVRDAFWRILETLLVRNRCHCHHRIAAGPRYPGESFKTRSIAVTAEESNDADAEIAVLEIGITMMELTRNAAFQENVRTAERVTKALLDAKVPKANIETEKLRLARTDIDEKWTADMKKERQFTAEQSWHITVSASDAQGVVDLAVKAGANEVEDVDWNVADPVALQAKAGGAALAKARSIADQMAKGLGTELGELVYATIAHR